MPTFVLSDESLNDRGSRVLTSGINLARFKKNPVMLWMHRRDDGWDYTQVLPIGKWSNIRVEEGKLMADPEFDEKDPFAALIKSKVDAGFVKGASVGISAIEYSTDPKHLLPGQTRASITKSELYEASIVDLPANKNCVRLFSAVDDTEIPLINNTSMDEKTEKKFSFESEDDLLTFMKDKFGFEPGKAEEKGKPKEEKFAFKNEKSFLSWLKEKFNIQPKAAETEKKTDETSDSEVEKLKTESSEKDEQIRELNVQLEALKKAPGGDNKKDNKETDAQKQNSSNDMFGTYSAAKATWDAVCGMDD